MEFSDLRKRFEAAGQGHVFKYFDELDDAQKDFLISQLSRIDLEELENLKETLLAQKRGAEIDYSKLEPAPYIPLPADKRASKEWQKAKLEGQKALSEGKVAAFVVAGGQGTRLGFNAPKGLYPVTPVKGKSLFQVFAEKILSASRKYGKSIPWLIMTSHTNDAATRKFFEENNYFGLNKSDVLFFVQGQMPAVDKSGKIILEDKGKIAMTPDGHGGCLRAMCRSGVIDELQRRGIECISYFQVDNPLVNILDPYFIGFHILGKSDMSSKMIPKAYPLEKVGHFCLLDGKLCVIEYSDLPEEYQRKVDENGKLVFLAGSVAIHILDRDFVKRLGSGKDAAFKLPFHRADKKIPYIDDNGNSVKPDKPNGVKFEMFVFDALPLASSPVIIEGARAEEFSPVKNAEGVDSPISCKNDQKKLFASWLDSVGEKIERDENGVPKSDIEISALFASNGEDFAEKWKSLTDLPRVVQGLYIE